MKLLDLLRAQWSIFGLEAPKFAWLAALGLVIFTFEELCRLSRKLRRESEALEDAREKVEGLRLQQAIDPRRGLTSAAYNALADVFGESANLKSAWSRFASLLVPRRSGGGEDEFWASDSADTAFTEPSISEGRLNWGYFNSIPGIVTGTGLLFTFIAILVALIDVRINTQTNQIEGLPLLIEGLSGKFVSSIAALFSAVVFLLIERNLSPRLSKARLRLVSSVDAVFPRLSAARILVEMQRDVAEQSAAFRSFNADLATKLKQGFSESLGPTIQRMVETIEELNRHLRAAEAQKQESITGSLNALLQNLEQSISSSLQTMGDRFKESLSGLAMDEFTRVTESLSGAARLLENMNAQFQTSQSALAELVNLAKASTVEQLALGKSQVEDLTAVLRQFMVQMNDTAGSSVRSMAATLTGVVHDLSNKVNDLGSQMAATLQKSADQATNAASVVVDKADKWSSRSAKQLEELVRQLDTHTKSTKEVENTLMDALGLFNDSLGQYASLNADLHKVANEVNAMASAAAGAAHSASDTQKALMQVSSHTAAQVDSLAKANRSQQEVWVAIQSSMEQYKKVFAQTERAAEELLGKIAHHVDSHLEITKRGYGELVKIADEHFAEATQKLGASVDELDEHLQDLTEWLEKVRGVTDGRRT